LEPFGLLNFLKTLLPPTEEAPQHPAPEEEKEPYPPPVEEEKENAYLRFIEQHDKRAKRK
jgi:hypothetical protein